MLAATIPFVDAWNSWYADTGNAPHGVAALRQKGDAAAREAHRDPAEIERTVAVLVQLPGGTGRISADEGVRPAVVPLSGPPEALAAELRAYARAGIGHVQLVIDPITAASIEALAPMLEALDAGGPA